MSNPTLTEAAPDVTVAEPALDEPALVDTVLAEEQELVTADLLVEEVSIDGMCGVY